MICLWKSFSNSSEFWLFMQTPTSLHLLSYSIESAVQSSHRFDIICKEPPYLAQQRIFFSLVLNWIDTITICLEISDGRCSPAEVLIRRWIEAEKLQQPIHTVHRQISQCQHRQTYMCSSDKNSIGFLHLAMCNAPHKIKGRTHDCPLGCPSNTAKG